MVHRGADERGLKERLFGSSSSRRRSEGRREGMHKEGGIGRKGDVVEDANQRNKREGGGAKAKCSREHERFGNWRLEISISPHHQLEARAFFMTRPRNINASFGEESGVQLGNAHPIQERDGLRRYQINLENSCH